MKRAILCSFVLLTLVAAAVAQDSSTAAAQSAAQSWLALVDKGDYSSSWDQAASMFKAQVTKEQWQQALKGTRAQFGNSLSRKLKMATPTTSLPGAPDGQYVVIQYDSSFQNKKSAVETVTPMLDKDGQWHVSGYFIR